MHDLGLQSPALKYEGRVFLQVTFFFLSLWEANGGKEVRRRRRRRRRERLQSGTTVGWVGNKSVWTEALWDWLDWGFQSAGWPFERLIEMRCGLTCVRSGLSPWSIPTRCVTKKEVGGVGKGGGRWYKKKWNEPNRISKKYIQQSKKQEEKRRRPIREVEEMEKEKVG